MLAIGVDIGGTKIATQVFDDQWTPFVKPRVQTLQDYDELLHVLKSEVAWARAQGAVDAPVGIAAPGLVNARSGLLFAANLCASGRAFPADIAQALGTPITYLNDGRAQAVSEACLGAGKDYRRVMALILGTGVGGGYVVDGHVAPAPQTPVGEFGHIAAPARLIAQNDLPLLPCGCGRMGCIESYIAGPGLVRLAQHMTGATLTAEEIAERRQHAMRPVWQVWCALVADLLCTAVLTLDPDVITLGGGLSKVPGVIADLTAAAEDAILEGVSLPPLVLAEGGDASGARGAAYAAWLEQNDG